ncbi:MAG TPA: hypothetical protein VMF52_21145 [Steroidobacteraceae bacterium]|nr:hypothetical protein [Steroidobacteraceae bacterium]
MSQVASTGEKLRRATQLWHAFLASTGQRFELAQFLNDPAVEKRTIEAALASGDPRLAGLAQEWLLGTGQAAPAMTAPRGAPAATPATAQAEANPAAKPSRYLKGVR